MSEIPVDQPKFKMSMPDAPAQVNKTFEQHRKEIEAAEAKIGESCGCDEGTRRTEDCPEHYAL